jgi:hypothetical protein
MAGSMKIIDKHHKLKTNYILIQLVYKGHRPLLVPFIASRYKHSGIKAETRCMNNSNFQTVIHVPI